MTAAMEKTLLLVLTRPTGPALLLLKPRNASVTVSHH